MRVNHPTKPGVSKSVPDDLASKWLDNGWTEVEDAPQETRPKKKAVRRSAARATDS